MGGAVSTGRNNEDLVDNLVSADYIRTPAVRKLFYAVDRADYFLPQCRKNAYKDLAWKSGHLHLSAPCIYSEVMEGLCLKPNLSFLNLGSGTGYLSTMVGLAIGSRGINHGIEIYPDVIEYANRKLEEFKRYSSAIDEYDLCEPKFIQGNCLCLSSGTLQYDRVYSGGACPAPHISYMKNLIKVGGILVVPIEDQLMQIERTSETTWEERSLLPVSFATLIQPPVMAMEFVNMMDVEPPLLQELCRTVVRNVLRNNINKEFPKLKALPKRKRISKRKHPLKRTIVPHLDTSDESEGEEAHVDTERSRSLGTFIDFVLGRVYENDSAPSGEPNAPGGVTESEHQENGNNHDAKSDLQENDVDQLVNSAHNDAPNTSTNSDANTDQPPQNPQVEINTGNGTVIARIMIRKRNRDQGIEEGNEDSEEDSNMEVTNTARKAETPSVTQTKREKFDSGLGDEIVDTASSDDEVMQELDEHKNEMDVDAASSSDEGNPRNRTNEPRETAFRSMGGRHWRTVTVPNYAVDHLLGHLDDDTPEEDTETVVASQPVIGPYTILMRNKIQQLPLPQTLKSYINYYKEF